jgi:hypothetical protein
MDAFAQCLRDQNNFSQARSFLEEAVLHYEAALKSDPQNPSYRSHLQLNRVTLAPVVAALGDHARAGQIAEQLATLGWNASTDTYNAACALALCIPIVEKTAALPEDDRRKLADSYSDRALAMLRQAIRRGYKDAANLKKDTDLDPLRSHPEFQKLLKELSGNPEGASPSHGRTSIQGILNRLEV